MIMAILTISSQNKWGQTSRSAKAEPTSPLYCEYVRRKAIDNLRFDKGGSYRTSIIETYYI